MDKYWKICFIVIGLINNLNMVNMDWVIEILKKLVKIDFMFFVCGDVLNVFVGLFFEDEVKGILEDRIVNDQFYNVVFFVLIQLLKIDFKLVIVKVEVFEKEFFLRMLVGIVSLYVDNIGMEKFDFY